MTPSLSKFGERRCSSSAARSSDRVYCYPRRTLTRLIKIGRVRRKGVGRANFGQQGCWCQSVALNAEETPPFDNNSVPDYPQALNLLYATYTVASYIERVWRFGHTLLLASLPGGFELIAITGFAGQLAAVLLGPSVGAWLDTVRRGIGLNSVFIMQSLSILVSGGMLLIAFGNGMDISTAPLFIAALTFLQMIERLCALAYDVSVERDWVVQLVGLRKAGALAEGNAWLRRYDLATELVGTFIFGWSITQFGPTNALIFYMGCTTVLAIISLALTNKIVQIAPKAIVEDRTPLDSQDEDIIVRTTIMQKFDFSEIFVMARKHLKNFLGIWGVYFRQAIFIPNVAFIFLYFNVALQPSGLLTAFLRQHGLSPEASAVFRGACAVTGMLGTIMVKPMFNKFGLVKSGAVSVFLFAGSLFVAASIFQLFLNGISSPGISSLILFCSCIAISRAALWAFDIINAQFFQMAVKRSEIAQISSTEYAMCALSELLMFGMAAIWRRPAQFGLLVWSSMGAVFLAFLLYFIWVMFFGGEKQVNQAIDNNVKLAMT